jgi:hypothetical protein
VALVAAGLGVVAGRQAVLFMGGRKNGNPQPKRGKEATVNKGRLFGRDSQARAPEGSGSGAPNESNPYSFGAPRWIKKGNSSIQTQKNGFGSFIQSFQRRDGKSKYGMPIFLPNGNVNPAYLAAERADIQSTSKKNTRAAEKKRKDLIKAGKFQLADYVRKEIGPAGSGRDFYQSGR